MKRINILFVILLVTTILLLIGWAYLNKSQIFMLNSVADDHAQTIMRTAQIKGITYHPNVSGIKSTEQSEKWGISNSLTQKTLCTIGASCLPTLSNEEAHRIALDAIKNAAGISNICSFNVHLEERNGRVFHVVTFLVAPVSDCKIENYLYKVGVSPTNGQVLFIRRPAD